MTAFMPCHTEADIDLASRNKMLSELLIEEFPNTEGMSTKAAEDYLRSKVIDKFNINHPEYQAHVSYDCTTRGDFITAWVTRRLALVKLAITTEDQS
ncbi:hypothetical protein [Pseudomonas phage vB_PaeM_PS119XW]|uniref:Uncharacterized protein n=1 Tax=Pseudomonas phage vB_PaeM_PS119XW TaxID=2601632 RepID=A0A5C1K7F9_9CAUD|nr:hypothetical protein PP933_gp386 [Pseudomonas phage vB_PaeM_PS119XW]QEM42108.1 hypothetical protein [Pseudomonas phage vB_PaeM_PS119XW]